MELIDQSKKQIMENCKIKAREAGLQFSNETLEYIVTNKDLNDLTSKHMIPTLYDYWMHDVITHAERGRYSIYPNNPFETVINTRPPISFYNDNNPDYVDCMIFYHVLGHIDFFYNNKYYKRTWDDDFLGKALSHKRRINQIREELGAKKRWVDYTLEFARSIDNIVSFYGDLESDQSYSGLDDKEGFFFGKFFREYANASTNTYLKEIEYYNSFIREYDEKQGKELFFQDVKKRFPEFESVYEKEKNEEHTKSTDLLSWILNNTTYLKENKFKWMKEIIEIVRDTSLFFAPQMRTKIMNEGWASYWHLNLFPHDDYIKGHEVDFAKLNANVVTIPKTGFNPYGIGLKLYEFIYDLAKKGRFDFNYQLADNIDYRNQYEQKTRNPEQVLFDIRRNLNDFTFINLLSEKDFQDFVTRYGLVVTGQRLNRENWTLETYIKSRKGEDYRNWLKNKLFHPPHIVVDEGKSTNDVLYLHHNFEGKQLVPEYIQNTMMGIEQLSQKTVQLRTIEFSASQEQVTRIKYLGEDIPITKNEVLYTMRHKKLEKRIIQHNV